ncbi:uncharacterized protein EV189_2423 [Motilibacter rhizosphaerae]|uniref:Metal-binding protein n=1 Tax=Motilibacter rhizosphaerae TaxID=598652 RepID=A0A4Q7NP08_9ACTN|nr:YceD family protein [Motilibacter rhizosphaerae]RZS87004.1 uncharacterized protein EV189_2423 [Motilibacter rhizosphaerae]
MPRRDREPDTARLDPRDPFVIDTRELGRRPGSMRSLTRSVPAPKHLGTDVIGVPEGSTMELELRLEAVMEGVLVSGTAQGQVRGECVRCLEPLEETLEVDLQELYAYPGSSSAEADEDEVHQLEGDLLDLEPVVRDAVVLALPQQPVCEEDCAGLCVECGARLSDDPEHTHEALDPRWAALGGLLGEQRPEQP